MKKEYNNPFNIAQDLLLTHRQIIYGNLVETCRPYSCDYTSETLIINITRIISTLALFEQLFLLKTELLIKIKVFHSYILKTLKILCCFKSISMSVK